METLTCHLSRLDGQLVLSFLFELLLLEDLVLLLDLVQVFVATVLEVFLQFAERWPIDFVKLQHHLNNLAELRRVRQPLLEPVNTLCNQLFTVELLRLLIESSDVLHRCELEEQ